MVDLLKAWHDDLNNLFTDDFDQRIQYREAAFYFIQAFISAGWVVERSTDGTNAPTASNQWTSPGVLLYGIPAQPVAWITLRSPDDYVDDDGNYVWILFALNHTNAGIANPTDKPQLILLRHSSATFTGGATNAYPTTTGNTVDQSNTFLLSTGSVGGTVRGRWNAWWTEDGDVMFVTKPDGSYTVPNLYFHVGPGGFADGGETCGPYRVAFFWAASNGIGDSANWSQIRDGVNAYVYYRANGIPSLNGGAFNSELSHLVWTADRESTNRIPDAPIGRWINSNAVGFAGQRYLGQWLDVRGAPSTTGGQPFNEVFDGDTDAIFYVLVGVLWVPSTERLL